MTMSGTVFRIVSRPKYHLELVLVLLLVAPVVMLTVTAFHWEMFKDPVLWAVILLMLVVLGFGTWAHSRYVKTARLSIDSSGMKLESDVPRFLAAGYQGPWEIRWGEVDRVSVLDRLGLLQIRRKGFARMPLALKLNDWTPEDVHGPAPTTDIRSTALWKALESHGLFAG